MQIEQLDLETRSKIYGYTKKVLRKYQKGIVTGKITADKFAENILSDGIIDDFLDANTLTQQDFKLSYIDYIQTLIHMQNEDLSNGKKKKNKTIPEKPSIPQKIQLKNLLASNDYSLYIPYQYLTANDVDILIKYISTGAIDLGNERIYNYVNRPKPN